MKGVCFSLALIVVVCVLASALQPSGIYGDDVSLRRRLADSPVVDLGTSNFLPKITVFSAIIANDQKSISASHPKHDQLSLLSNYSLIINEAIILRQKNVQSLVKQIPLNFVMWPSINTKPCPHYVSSGHTRHEKGSGLAHFQIWLEFVFFDNDLLDALKRPKPEYLTSNSYSSISGIFKTTENGTNYKNGVPFLEEDIMIILDDSATLMASPTNTAVNGTSLLDSKKQQMRERLVKELRSMQVDMLSLSGGGAPSTLAYALTRKGARKLIQFYDHCGKPLDEQIQRMVSKGFVSYSVAKSAMFTTLSGGY